VNPATIGRYQLLRPIASGGMADVYLARDPALGREVALKLPKLERLTAEGLARFRGEAQAVARLEHPAIVPIYEYGDTGLAIGTVDYMSPEQALGRPNLDGRSDVYSLGVVLFEMLAGDVPYKADSALQQAMQHVSAPIPSIRERRPDLPPATQTVIEHALAKEPRDRYATASTTAIDLRRVAGGARPAGASAGRGRIPAWLWAVAAVAVALILFIAISGGRRSAGRETTLAAVPTTAANVAATIAPTISPTDEPIAAVPAAATSTVAIAVPATATPPTSTSPAPTATPAPTLPPAPAADALPFFMTRLVTADDLAGLSAWELDVMRNEIFARHGRGFNRADLQAHFDAQPWYTRRYDPVSFPTDRLLTDVQEANAAFILTYQQQTP